MNQALTPPPHPGENLCVPRLPFLLAYALPLLHLVGVELRGPWTFQIGRAHV